MFCCQDSQLLALAYEKVIMRKGIWIGKKFQLVSYYFNYATKSAISLPISKVAYRKLIQRLCDDTLFLYSFHCMLQIHIYHLFCLFKTSCWIMSIHAFSQQYLLWSYNISGTTYYPYFQGMRGLFWERKYTVTQYEPLWPCNSISHFCAS